MVSFHGKKHVNGECCIVMFDYQRVYVICFDADYLILMVLLVNYDLTTNA